MSDKKYSVFISSTYEDLKDQRDAVLRAILQHGHFPLGMELWGAADEQQWHIIQRQIDVADYYVIIVAHRYGSSVDGVSWTEREYDYAVEKGVPVLGFVIDRSAEWPPEFVEKGWAAESMERFKAKVKTRPVSSWKNADQLRTEVILALGRQIQSIPRSGWIRGSDAISPEVSNELARLSSENAALRTTLKNLSEIDLPNCPIEIISATVSALNRPNSGPSEGLRVGISFCTTLLGGKAPGFVDQGAEVEISFQNGVSIVIEPTFNRIHPVIIDGPAEIWLNGWSDSHEIPPLHEIHEMDLALKLRPIGYTDCYSVVVKLFPTREATVDVFDQETTEWIYSSKKSAPPSSESASRDVLTAQLRHSI